ncbi:M50 family metallopeptidase [Staphylococcus hyicus]|uniref:M50 family metallopeptidase n=1 Tax=Staphylococcus hyicus TaxID=1284 RepID=A0ACD5FL64_STAHY|nr:M50 family metallopeptidase [Staphylococcus hyicus]AJC96833.1 membrane protein [Staphylococcus hyicus]MCE5153604.1 M50 family metallopeptidase [Staphylococcus hyicus]MCO4331622.1 M50 family metallopeptidase [Staphylococcus hyicus]MCO4334831.1 M50 family metallopeptidase [Staphylococcus hyicus]MCQ9290008.1 M50 family metallopeptidase [Staphylococcus hyicus]
MMDQSWLISPVPISIILLIIITALYLVSHYYQRHPVFSVLDILLNYIPVLTHEFGHVLFNRLSGGRAVDFVVVVKRSERLATGQQGYAITKSRNRLGQIWTTLGGYIMPPFMLSVGLIMQSKGYGALFILFYVLIFLYFTCVTSRKWTPILIILFLSMTIYLGVQSENLTNYSLLYMLIYHFLLGTLLGEVLQSTVTIAQLTFSRPKPSWDGSALSALTHIPTIFYSSIWVILNFTSMYFLFQQLFGS